MCILFLGRTAGMTFNAHAFQLEFWPFVLLAALLFLLIAGLGLFFSKALSRSFRIPVRLLRIQDLWSWLPVFFLLCLPLALRHYMDADDLAARTRLLIAAAAAAVLYLKGIMIWKARAENPSRAGSWTAKLKHLPQRKKIILLFLAALLVFNAGSFLIVSEGMTFSGDEPHYLMISHSLLHDGDVNLANNYKNRDYVKYMPAETRLVRHIAPGTKGQYSFHSSGFSALMLPFYALASLFKGKLLALVIRFSVSLIGALLGIQVYLYALQAWKSEKLAVILWALFSFTSPAYFYGFHFYPELLITLLSLYVFRLLSFKTSFSVKSILGLGFVLSTFIWFHAIKYPVIAGSLILYGLWILLKKHKLRWRALYLLVFPVMLTLLHLYFQYNLYGSLSLSAISTEGQLGSGSFLAFVKSMFQIPFRFRWETFAGYFLDQKDGFLLYAPIYFFAFLGMIEMFRRKREDLYALLVVMAPYILFSAFMTQRTGYAPQARPLVAVFWGFGIMLGYFLAYNAKKIFTVLFAAAAFLSYLFAFLLLRNPISLYQLTTFGETQRAGTLFLHMSNLHFFLPKFLPSFVKMENGHWPPNLFWTAAVPVFMIIYWVVKKHDFSCPYGCHVAAVIAGLVIFSGLAVLYPGTVLLHPTKAAFPSGERVVFYSLGRVAKMPEPGKFILPQADRDYVFYFTSWRDISKFRLEWGADKGTYDVRIRYFDTDVFQGLTEGAAGKRQTLAFAPQTSYPLKAHHLYRITLSLKRLSAVSPQQYPYRFSIIPD